MGIKISTLTGRAKYFVAAAALVATSAPFGVLLPTAVYADEPEGVGAHDTTELKNLLNAGGDVKLCANITGGVNVGYHVDGTVNATLDLNGYTLTAGDGGQALIISKNAVVTLTGEGSVYDSNKTLITVNGSLTINSGEYRGLINVVGGSLTVNDGDFTANGPIFGLGNKEMDTDSIVINDGSFSGVYIANKAYSGGGVNSTFTINDGNFRNVETGITKNDSLKDITTINGGYFGADPTGYEADDKDVYEYNDLGTHYQVGPEAELTVSNAVVPVGELVEIYRVSPAEYNEVTIEAKNSNGAVVDDVEITEMIDESTGEIIGYASTESVNRKEIDVKNNSGLSGHVTMKPYTVEGDLDDRIMVVGATDEVDITTKKWNVAWALSSDNEDVVSVDADGKTLVAQGSGEATIAVTFDDSNETTRIFTVRVYDLNTDEEVVLIKKNKTTDIITDSNWRTDATVTEGDVELTDNSGSYTIKGLNAGLSTVEFTIDVNGDGEADATKNVKVYVYEVNDNEVVLEKGESVNEDTINSIFVKNSDDVTLSVKENTVDTTIVENNGLALTAVGAGDTEVVYRMAVGDKHATMKLKVHVWSFVTEGMEDYYDLGNAKTEIDVPFSVYDENENAEISYTIKDASGADITDAGDIIVEQDGTEYLIRLASGVRGGEYTIEFTDTFMGEVRTTASTTVRVHELTVDGDAEHYIVMSRNQFSRDNYYDVTATGNFAANRDITATVDGTPVGGVTASYRHWGNWRIAGREAGSFSVTFSDGFAETTIMTYVIQFTFGQDSYHVGVDEGYQFIYAYNKYWQEENRDNDLKNTKLTVVRDADGEVVAETEYDYGMREMNDSDRYKFEFCNEESGDCLEAGNYTIYFNAYANGGARATKSVRLHLYEMVTPEYDTRYVYVDDDFEIDVHDKNERAFIRAEVVDGDTDGIGFESTGWFSTDYTSLTAEKPGVYTVRYYDYMGNGELLGTWEVRVVVVEVEKETLLVRKGDTFTLTGSSAWTAELAVDDTTGVDDFEFTDGEAEVDSSDMELGEHLFYIGHEFDEFDDGPFPPRMDIKETTIYVYEITSDEEDDPEDVTGFTLQDLLDTLTEEGLADDLLESNFFRLMMLAGRDDVQALFGDNFFEAFLTLRELRNAILEGEEILTEVEVYEYTEEEVEEFVSEDLTELMAFYGPDGVKYFDISVVIRTEYEVIGYLHQLNDNITVYVTDAEEPEAGYARDYIVARKHGENEPEVLVMGENWYIANGKLYIVASEFSTYAVAYVDTVIPAAPDTGALAVAALEGESAVVATTAALAAVAVATALGLAGAVVFAKRR